jgi:hypothetical protein
VRVAQELLGVPTIGGECQAQRCWRRESKKSNKPSKPPRIYKNGAKTGGFPQLLIFKMLKTPFFT